MAGAGRVVRAVIHARRAVRLVVAMTDLVLAHIIPAALSLLPPAMDSPAAHAMLLAIGLQESRFQHRRQVGGPARSFWMFERNGVKAVATHQRLTVPLSEALVELHYPVLLTPASLRACHAVLEHNDVLACVFARLLLWSLPRRLPTEEEPDRAWDDYLAAWRPGKPHRSTWNDFYAEAWRLVQMEGSIDTQERDVSGNAMDQD